jgi:hypothetical protein
VKHRKRGAPKRKAQRRAKWQADKRFSKRHARQAPRKPDVHLLDEFDDDARLALVLPWPDGHALSPYARKEA